MQPDYDSAIDAGAAGGTVMLMLLLLLAGYVYFGFTLMVIARKTNTANPWMAWVPFANLFLMCKIARKSMVWFVIGLIPLVNIIAVVVLFMGMAEARGKASWLGLLILVPMVNFFVPLILAAGDSAAPKTADQPSAVPPPNRNVSQDVRNKNTVTASATFPGASRGEQSKDGPLVCPKCGTPFGPQSAFCSGCGLKRPEAVKRCQCGAERRAGEMFCSRCGTQFQPQPNVSSQCSSCGSDLNEGVKFCGKCGASVINRPVVTTAAVCVNPQCRQPLKPGKKFCTVCGTPAS